MAVKVVYNKKGKASPSSIKVAVSSCQSRRQGRLIQPNSG